MEFRYLQIKSNARQVRVPNGDCQRVIVSHDPQISGITDLLPRLCLLGGCDGNLFFARLSNSGHAYFRGFPRPCWHKSRYPHSRAIGDPKSKTRLAPHRVNPCAPRVTSYADFPIQSKNHSARANNIWFEEAIEPCKANLAPKPNRGFQSIPNSD